jgi:NAD(P)-dependent dehydrogenase (short-subunit alcohol dehydrogenase family)
MSPQRVALVTGATYGIGRGILDRLVQDDVAVFAVARKQDELAELESVSPEAGTFAADLTKPDSAAAAVGACIDRFGRLDALVNNVGGGSGSSWDAPDEEWSRMFELNVLSAVRMCRAAVPHLTEVREPRIVNISTELVFQPGADWVAYTAAKSALMSFTKSLSSALAERGILVNALCSGSIDTPLSRGYLTQLAAERGAGVDETIRYFCENIRGIPLGRLGRIEEVAESAVFLASERCRFVTGAVLRCDGGSSPSPL